MATIARHTVLLLLLLDQTSPFFSKQVICSYPPPQGFVAECIDLRNTVTLLHNLGEMLLFGELEEDSDAENMEGCDGVSQVDASGSMGGARIVLATQAAYALSAVLERLRITHEVICFTTGPIAGGDSSAVAAEEAKMGRSFTRDESLYMPILKGFNERLSTETKSRFGWLPNSRILRNNVDGECVEIAARRLLSQPQNGKILMVLSDGSPNASGDTGRLSSHLKEVVKETMNKGVNVIGIGIQTDSVQKYYPKNVVIHKAEDLPQTVIKELRNMLLN